MKRCVFTVLSFVLLIGCSSQKSLDEELIKAARSGLYVRAERLISEGADVNAADDKGWTPLMYAASSGNTDLVKLFLGRGASLDLKNAAGMSAAEIAASGNIPGITGLLGEKGGNPPGNFPPLENPQAPRVSESPDSNGSTVEEIPLKYGTIRTGISMNDMNQIVDRSVVAEARGETPQSATLSSIEHSVSKWRFALNGREYELFFSKGTTPRRLAEIRMKPFNRTDFPEIALIGVRKEPARSRAVRVIKVRLFQDPDGSDYAGWKTEISFTATNTGDAGIDRLPFAVIAYTGGGEPNSLATFGPGAGQYTSWGVVEGELKPGATAQTSRVDLGVLYHRPASAKVIILDEELSESETVEWIP